MIFNDLKSGKSVGGDEIKAYISEFKSNRYIYLMAGVHGDEVEGVYVVQKLFEWLKAKEEIELPLIVIPILNVDGYLAETRTNGHGVDLNRNFKTDDWTSEARSAKYHPGPSPLSEPENKFLIGLFEKFHPGVILTIHSWKPMINFNGDCKDIADLLSQHNHYITCDDIEGHPTPGSLGTYAPTNYQCPVITFECPTINEELTLQDVWAENEVAFKTLFESDLLLQRTKN